ncbi:hypothetical protein HQ305_19925 [Rhodococcus sp. BP-149]|uniref:hypothetical protein n=1 Tax=unclassified Rhodococcus (in: high G+C Gram-positive bacteria) TaxID=192944 RepID=UPI001C9ABD41|nr:MULTISPECIES: hypothetical protein [unclassified Rhodococcus (in: high G+C Gram-positive bacteria)]MBY6687505.1 hypothetical protein [Rhodococcus sp. BP-288]MBY6695670.1 hypothetical protein [Rhodococcus sp. BP-188]MBY6700532.1 hypothetical protein [Rhodococcus sp. BP-285]MBY6704445.1 hypothetical protein [Rhodococcus sp. BP-283]MBY6713657.1 hypothetical protein [Rhodococcus sp. BP-160]
MTSTEARRSWTPEQRRRVRAAAAGASIKLREYDNKPVPQWLRDVAAGKPTAVPPEQP